MYCTCIIDVLLLIMLIKKHVVLLIFGIFVLNGIDAVSTYFLINEGLYEFNPYMNYCIQQLGLIPGLILPKFIFILGLLILVYFYYKDRTHAHHLISIGLIVTYISYAILCLYHGGLYIMKALI